MKRSTSIENLLVAHPKGLTHRELAQLMGIPEPSVRVVVAYIRENSPRFKPHFGRFDVVVDGERDGYLVFKAQSRELPPDTRNPLVDIGNRVNAHLAAGYNVIMPDGTVIKGDAQ